MAAIETGTSAELIRSNLWSNTLKTVLTDEMQAQKYVQILNGFPDGDTFNIPSIGARVAKDYVEGTAIQYTPYDTGNFTFSIDKYIQDGVSISKKAKQDLFYANELMARFVPDMTMAIMKDFETTTLAAPEAGITANSAETINGAAHRISGGNAGKIEVADFAYADYALTKANVPTMGRVGIVDPSIAFELGTLSNIVNVANTPRWEGIIETGMTSGLSFIANVYGFDLYTSNYLADVTDSALNERDGSTANDFSTTNGKANLFFSTAAESFIGAWRQMPEVDFEYNKDLQQDEYAMTARYGVKTFRPENMVVVATDPTVNT